MSLPCHRVAAYLSSCPGITNASRTPCQRPFLLFPAPVYSYSSPAMTSPLVPLLQRQFDTTLRLLISASHGMTTDEIMLVRIRLAEASLVLGDIIVGRSDSATNGKPASTPPLRPHWLMTDVLNDRRTSSPPSRPGCDPPRR